jgi:hypothetical protein
MIGQQTRARVENPARWLKAAERAVAEGIQVRQLQGTGQWIANSGTDAAVAYELEVTGNVAHGCDCLAGLNGDPVCKHRAAWYLLVGAIDLTPEPEPPAPLCFRCQGRDVGCPVCAGDGIASLTAQAAALVAAAEPATSGADRMVAEDEPDTTEYLGRSGHVAGYDIFLAGDTMLVTHAASGQEWRHVVPNFGTALADLAHAPGLRLGWVRFPDDAEAIYAYDCEDGNFGYAFNLDCAGSSEWGYAPFAGPDDEACDECGGPLDEDAEYGEALTLCGACVERQLTVAWAARQAAIAANHAATVREDDQLAA